MDRQKAEEMYLEGSKFAVTDDEVHQFTSKLMQKNLSQTEAMERLDKAEKVIARLLQWIFPPSAIFPLHLFGLDKYTVPLKAKERVSTRGP